MSNYDYDDVVEGRNAVYELLESGKDINKIYIAKGELKGNTLKKILSKAKENKILITEVDRKKLNELSSEGNHQGVIAVVPPYNYVDVDDILDYANQKNEKPFVLILDQIEDPHNLGSIIRSAETAGVHGIIIPKRRAASVNATVNKTSAGAAQHMKIARVNNLTQTINYLKEKGLWIYAADMDTTKLYYEEDYTSAVGIVIGSEGRGVSKIVKDNSDVIIKIPMKGKITSLNASVSAGIIIYEIVKQRG